MDAKEWLEPQANIVPKKELKGFMKRDNWHGVTHLCGHFATITATGIALFASLGTWWMVPLMVLHGVLIAFLYAPLHETIHSSVFKKRWLNKWVGHLAGLIILRPFLYSKYRHMAHHTFTQHPEHDPDQVGFPGNFREYSLYIAGFSIWPRLVSNLFNLTLGRFSEEEREFIPANERSAVIREARVFMGTYALVIVASIWTQSWLAVLLWLLPRVIGETVLRAFRMVEHTGMDEGPDMLANTRTTTSNMFVRALYWNMPYHVEHHLYPSVPFHQLPKLHRKVGPHAKEVAPGVLKVHADIVRLVRQRRRTRDGVSA